jgi:hypothetical protein
MTGESDNPCFWPDDADFDGPYGYNVLIIQKNGFRLFRSAITATSIEPWRRCSRSSSTANHGAWKRPLKYTARVELALIG